MTILIKNIMTTDIISLPVSQTVSRAAEEMITNAISSIIIIADNDFERPVGIITMYDVLKLFLNNERSSIIGSLKNIVKPLITISDNLSISQASQKFLEFNIHHLICCNNNQELTGIISTWDLAKQFDRLND